VHTLGDYRLIERLGEGAAGEVYLAVPIKARPFAEPGIPVAIKRYKPQILTEAHQTERIEREFSVGSQLSHPNLVRVFEYIPGPAPYVVMEYVDGVPLDKWLNQFHPVPRRLLVKFVEQLMSAIKCLHDAGILHRDLKPQNIMVTSTFDLKVMDLGVVRISKDTKLTPENKFLGTIRNSAPEMLFGHDYDNRADLYSLGTVFYALVHGEQIYADEDQFARLITLIEKEEVLFDPGVGQLDEVRVQLFETTKALLSKSPANRPASIDALTVMVEPLIAASKAGQPIEPLHGYVATALTGLDADSRDSIMFASSKIADVAKAYDVYVYQPRKATDPLLHKEIDATAVYQLDRRRVLSADLLIVMANRPSFGVGQELEIAASFSVPTILLLRAGTKVSRMVTGSPAYILDEITYDTPEDLERKFRRVLARHLEKIRRWRNLVRVPSGVNVGNALASLRLAKGYTSAAELAESLGLSPRLLQGIESGDYQNISFHILDLVAKSLGATLTELIQPEPSRSAPSNAPMDANLRRLETTAKKLGWPAVTYFELRDDYQRQLAASGEASAITEEQWMARHSMLERRRLTEKTDDGQKTFF
jgi:transcriptional regulator with XRE-family HTH domain